MAGLTLEVGGRLSHPAKGPGTVTNIEKATDQWGVNTSGFLITLEYDTNGSGPDVFNSKYLYKFTVLRDRPTRAD